MKNKKIPIRYLYYITPLALLACFNFMSINTCSAQNSPRFSSSDSTAYKHYSDSLNLQHQAEAESHKIVAQLNLSAELYTKLLNLIRQYYFQRNNIINSAPASYSPATKQALQELDDSYQTSLKNILTPSQFNQLQGNKNN